MRPEPGGRTRGSAAGRCPLPARIRAAGRNLILARNRSRCRTRYRSPRPGREPRPGRTRAGRVARRDATPRRRARGVGRLSADPARLVPLAPHLRPSSPWGHPNHSSVLNSPVAMEDGCLVSVRNPGVSGNPARLTAIRRRLHIDREDREQYPQSRHEADAIFTIGILWQARCYRILAQKDNSGPGWRSSGLPRNLLDRRTDRFRLISRAACAV